MSASSPFASNDTTESGAKHKRDEDTPKSVYASKRRRITNIEKTLLGRGAFGNVYKGVINDNSVVAIKEQLINSSATEREKKRLQLELRFLLLTCHSQYFTGIYSFDVKIDANNSIYVQYVLPFMPFNLSQLICDVTQQLSYRHILSIFHQLLTAISVIHKLGFAHCDIKPANILMNEKCKIKICDFGSAQEIEAGTQHAKKSLYVGNGVRVKFTDNSSKYGRIMKDNGNDTYDILLSELDSGSEKKVLESSVNKSRVEYIQHYSTMGYRNVKQHFDPILESVGFDTDLFAVAIVAIELFEIKSKSSDEKHIREKLFIVGNDSNLYACKLLQIYGCDAVCSLIEDESTKREINSIKNDIHFLGVERFISHDRDIPRPLMNILSNMFSLDPAVRKSAEEILAESFSDKEYYPIHEDIDEPLSREHIDAEIIRHADDIEQALASHPDNNLLIDI
jgi:serine/threonine protein kinase